MKQVSRNEPFVTLMVVAQKDPEIKTWLTGILSLDSFNRKSALNTLLQQLLLEQAPGDFIGAIEALLDDQVAQRTLELLANEEADAQG